MTLPLEWVTGGLLGAAVALLALNFRFVLYPLIPRMNPTRHATRVKLDGRTLFISDLHLRAGSGFQYAERIHHLLDTMHVANLVIVGDLFDSPQDARAMMDEGQVAPVGAIVGFAGLPVKVFFVQGSPLHDPKPTDELFKGTSITFLGKCAVLEYNRVRVVVYHGHDLSVKGAVGHGWDRFVSGLSLERAWKRLSGIASSDWVIFGHTHIPGVDMKNRVANCGGWQTIRFLVHPTCTGLHLSPENDSLEVVNFAR